MNKLAVAVTLFAMALMTAVAFIPQQPHKASSTTTAQAVVVLYVYDNPANAASTDALIARETQEWQGKVRFVRVSPGAPGKSLSVLENASKPITVQPFRQGQPFDMAVGPQDHDRLHQLVEQRLQEVRTLPVNPIRPMR